MIHISSDICVIMDHLHQSHTTQTTRCRMGMDSTFDGLSVDLMWDTEWVVK